MGIFGSSSVPASPVGGAVLGSAPGIIGGVFNMFAARRERKFAREMWDAQNAYNTPAAQLARYKEAGINPAYGAGMASGNAAPMSNSAAVTARLDMPNVLASIGEYQSIKNAEIEGQRLTELVNGAKLDNAIKDLNRQFLDKTLNPRVNQQVHKETSMQYESGNKGITYDWRNELLSGGKNPELNKYNLDAQRFSQNAEMFKIDLALQELALERGKFGIDSSSSELLKLLVRSKTGLFGDKITDANDLKKYYIGEGFTKFGGDILKTMTPKLPFQRYKFNYEGARGYKKPTSRMPRVDYSTGEILR